MKGLIALALACLIGAVALAGRPHAFTDPMTHRDGGVIGKWGPYYCAVWTWSEPDVTNTYRLPVNCSR